MIIWKKIRTGEWIPWTYLLMLVFDLVYNSLVYYGGQWVGTHTKAWNIETSLDQQIPVIPWFVGIYLSFFLFCTVNFLVMGYFEKMCGTSGKDGMRDLLSVFSDHESSPGDRGNRFLEPGACRAVSDGCGGQSVSVDSLHGQLVLCGGDSEYPKRTGMASCDHMDLGGGDLCLHLIYQTARMWRQELHLQKFVMRVWCAGRKRSGSVSGWRKNWHEK